MRLSLYFIEVAIVFLIASTSFASSINWHEYSPEAFALAKKSNQPIVLYSKSSTCKWCKKMAATTLKDPKIIKLLNEKFQTLLLTIDNDSDIDTAAKLGITELPTVILYDKNGQEIKTMTGYTDANVMLDSLSNASK